MPVERYEACLPLGLAIPCCSSAIGHVRPVTTRVGFECFVVPGLGLVRGDTRISIAFATIAVLLIAWPREFLGWRVLLVDGLILPAILEAEPSVEKLARPLQPG